MGRQEETWQILAKINCLGSQTTVQNNLEESDGDGERHGVNDEESNEDTEPVDHEPSQDSNVSFHTLVNTAQKRKLNSRKKVDQQPFLSKRRLKPLISASLWCPHHVCYSWCKASMQKSSTRGVQNYGDYDIIITNMNATLWLSWLLPQQRLQEGINILAPTSPRSVENFQDKDFHLTCQHSFNRRRLEQGNEATSLPLSLANNRCLSH